MMNKTILITGSTDGIGKLAAIQLAKDGHELYLHGRNSDKLSAVITEVKELSNNENVKGFVADFSDRNAIKEMAAQINMELSKMDVLINNAGVLKSPTANNKDGLEFRFAVNYFAPYLLTNALIPLLEKGTEPRIINLSSAAQATVSNTALLGKTSISTQAAYAQSKLAITMWSFHLAKAYENITTIAVNPGSLLNTNMVKEGYGFHRSSADKGGNILYDLAVSEEYKNSTGQYFDNDLGEEKGTFGKAHPEAYHQKAIDQLIELTKSVI